MSRLSYLFLLSVSPHKFGFWYHLGDSMKPRKYWTESIHIVESPKFKYQSVPRDEIVTAQQYSDPQDATAAFST